MRSVDIVQPLTGSVRGVIVRTIRGVSIFWGNAIQRALEGRSGRTERSKGAQGRIMHQRPENRGALNKPTSLGRGNLTEIASDTFRPYFQWLRFIRRRWRSFSASSVSLKFDVAEWG